MKFISYVMFMLRQTQKLYNKATAFCVMALFIALY